MWEDCETGKYRKSILKQLFEAATDILGVTLKKAPEVFTTTVVTIHSRLVQELQLSIFEGYFTAA